MLRPVLVSMAVTVLCMAQVPHTPNIESQRSAMKKLEFLVGKWSGEARVYRLPSQPVGLAQTEDAYYKLDGLLLIIEGVGRNRTDGKIALQALGVVSYDDEAGTYRMRAFNDGRYLETELKLSETGKGISWGFTLGDVKTSSVLRINDKGQWTELTDITVGSQVARKFMELTVDRQ
jgi:hypothetical protein